MIRTTTLVQGVAALTLFCVYPRVTDELQHAKITKSLSRCLLFTLHRHSRQSVHTHKTLMTHLVCIVLSACVLHAELRRRGSRAAAVITHELEKSHPSSLRCQRPYARPQLWNNIHVWVSAKLIMKFEVAGRRQQFRAFFLSQSYSLNFKNISNFFWLKVN